MYSTFIITHYYMIFSYYFPGFAHLNDLLTPSVVNKILALHYYGAFFHYSSIQFNFYILYC